MFSFRRLVCRCNRLLFTYHVWPSFVIVWLEENITHCFSLRPETKGLIRSQCCSGNHPNRFRINNGKTNLYFQYPFMSHLSRSFSLLAWYSFLFVDYYLLSIPIHWTCLKHLLSSYVFPPSDLSKLSVLPHLYLTSTTCFSQSWASLGSVKAAGLAPPSLSKISMPPQQSHPFRYHPSLSTGLLLIWPRQTSRYLTRSQARNTRTSGSISFVVAFSCVHK